MVISEDFKLDRRLVHISFDLKNSGRIIKSKAIVLNATFVFKNIFFNIFL